MAKLSDQLLTRFMKKEKSKMSSLATLSTGGALSSFAGIFGMTELNTEERNRLSLLLSKYASDEIDITQDLEHLSSITAEVRAINNQAALLHGERIKRAQSILTRYREGAFSAWLLATYGNRQTPYNFLQYYEFFQLMPADLHKKIEMMPRQAIYTLASREGNFDQKRELVQKYQGETKEEVLTLIRTLFPLSEEDQRREDLAQSAIRSLEKILWTLENRNVKPRDKQREQLLFLLKRLSSIINSK